MSAFLSQPAPKNTSGNLNPNQGQNTSLAITKSLINGPICPLSFQSEEKTNTQILKFSKEKSTLLLGISSSKSTTLNISEIDMARNFGIKLLKSEMNISGKGLYVDNHSKMYFKGNGLVTIESLRQFISNIEIRGSFEGIMAGAFKENEPGTPTSGEAYAHLQITGFGNPLLISSNFKIGDGGKMTVVLYANGQKTDVYQSQILMGLFDVERESNYQVEADGTVALDPK
jgi:hypothetical protein